MNCDKYHELLSRYVDSEVTPRQRRELLAHVERCRTCAAWLARIRQTEVLLKGTPETQPSDRVRDAVLGSLRNRGVALDAPQPTRRAPWLSLPGVGLGLALRFDLSVRRIAYGAIAALLLMVAAAYWLNLLPPLTGYSKLGFDLPPDPEREAVNSTPISAISQGVYGIGGPVAVPNIVRFLPADGARGAQLNESISVRFDQPMDRASVETALDVDPPVAGAFTWPADNEVSFTPAPTGLLRGVTYTVLLTATARSLAGVPLDEPASWSFQTRPPYAVASDPPSGATIAPTATFTLNFETPMDKAGAARGVSLHAAQSGKELPTSLFWDESGRNLTVAPVEALVEGEVSLRVAQEWLTQSGDTLGRAVEYIYNVELPAPRLRLLGGRVVVGAAGADAITIRYEAVRGKDGAVLQDIRFELYSFPAERLSVLGAQARGWPYQLSADALAGLTRIEPFQPLQTGADAVEVTGLAPGIYLLVASAPTTAGALSDWQLLLAGDGQLALTGEGAPLRATNQAGHAWNRAEISLYSPSGALLEKGWADERGLWLPPARGSGATLAVARDTEGHLAALILDPPGRWEDPAGALPATMQTDLAAYHPGQTVNFRALLQPVPGASSVADQDVSVLLVMPQGQIIAALTLKPDAVGGVTGHFNLSPNLKPGAYKLRVRAGNAQRDFAISVVAPPDDTLSVAIVPGESLGIDAQVITRTVSVLASRGAPASGAYLTATLGIRGDAWVSTPVTARTDKDGRAVIVSQLPAWVTDYNDPGLYVKVEAELSGLRGSDLYYLDLTSERVAQIGMKQMVSPALDVAVVARPMADNTIRVRVVALQQAALAGDLLVMASAPTGESLAWSLDLASQKDVTLVLPGRFGGGRMHFSRAGVPTSREIELMPSQDPTLLLRVTAPPVAGPNAPVPVTMSFVDADGQRIGGGIASLWLRRVSGEPEAGRRSGWEPAVKIDTNGASAAMLTVPRPGLWYVMAQGTTDDGVYLRSWSVLRVLPGPSIQVPVKEHIRSGETNSLTIVVHNPGGDVVSSGVRTNVNGSLKLLGAGSQPIQVPPGGWQRLDWRYTARTPGLAALTFTFMPSSSIGGSWVAEMEADANPQTTESHVSGVLAGEQRINVQVPSGLSGERVQLEVRASTSLLSTLSSITNDWRAGQVGNVSGAAASAARLGAASSVAAAYSRAGYGTSGIELSSVERSLALQYIYSTQHADGGWGEGGSAITDTAQVLLAIRRQQLSWTGAGNEAPPPVDNAVISRGVAYLSSETSRPVGDHEDFATLDARAYGLYALSFYGLLDADWARSLMRYATANGQGARLSRAGQAWLALALRQAGDTANAHALLDSLLETEPAAGDSSLAPILEALVAAGSATQPGQAGRRDPADYEAAASTYARALMESRNGAGWSQPAMTADAIWALSLYATIAGERPNRGEPLVTLHDRPVKAAGRSDNPGVISVIVSGDSLNAGNNWLKLKAPAPGQSLYYSLTLRATR